MLQKTWYYANVPLSSADLPLIFLLNQDGTPNDSLISYHLGTEAVAKIHNQGIILTDEPDSFFGGKHILVTSVYPLHGN